MKPEEVIERVRPKNKNEALAEANFKLGLHFHEKGNEELANKYWEAAQKLNPDDWNYHRQDWAFTPKEAGARRSTIALSRPRRRLCRATPLSLLEAPLPAPTCLSNQPRRRRAAGLPA
jgi:hypothetical protein